ncbi:MAG TPA: sialate O-acetylesterase [Spirochaetota bacterium]|nr:sialate O-acetylesterase [Spirochaetota bacterium]
MHEKKFLHEHWLQLDPAHESKRLAKIFIQTAIVFTFVLNISSCFTVPVKQKTGIELSHGIATDTTWRTPAQMSMPGSGKVMVALALGQSNSANFGETCYTSRREVYNYYEGNLYLAEDPMLGADGPKGSVWTRFADMVIESGMYEKVVFVTIGIGATSVECWTDGECSGYLRETLADLAKHNIKLTHILWHQGEQDNLEGTDHSTYTSRMGKLLAIFREYGQAAPMYVSIASYQPNDFSKNFISREVRQGQVEFINNTGGVLCGPDTDKLVSKENRYDGVHFSNAGLKSFARLWFNAIRENSEKGKVR